MGLEKISEYKKKMHLTTKELSNRSGIPISTLSKLLTGESNNPTLKNLQALANVFECSLNDFGALDTFDLSISNSEREQIRKIRKMDPYGRKAVNTLIDIEFERILQTESNPDVARWVDLPFQLLKASAGSGQFLDAENFEMRAFKNPPVSADFALKISGDSMEPKFSDEETVFVHQQPDLEDGQIGIFVFNGEGYIKQMDRKGHSLISLNTKYDPILITGSDQFRIVGKVVGKAQR
ncbi:XRE family transcriptional regulator [Pseudoramibacter faecis]|uniref:LexA family transcriptional regulator n=1 Tax=Pseudoramibacter faecis TaxID=3108534 RepID=UPI002E7971C0|nr:XRE family transcriptional regulator [Pseudoramibacter sp. HA2172]